MNKSKILLRKAMPFILGGSLVRQIIVGLVLGILLAWISPTAGQSVGFLGQIFTLALKAVAPILVFVLVASAIANQDVNADAHFKSIIVLYLLGTFFAALVGVVASFLWPTPIHLVADAKSVAAPGGILEVLKNLVLSVVDNPVNALLKGNYIGILAWAIGLGIALRTAKANTLDVLNDCSRGVEYIVRLVIRFAPIGIFGLVANTVSTTGFGPLLGYAQLLLVLIGAMLFVALVMNPFIVWLCIRRNPYPLTWATLRESGVTAFFTRSSAANIPVNLNLCRKLGLDESTYSVTIPLGATINMAGAAITISVLALAACASLGIHVDIWTAVLLSVVSALCACGAAGVPGGSLMLIPLACSLFGIGNDVAMQVVAVGFIIGVLQDSSETALNSSSDVLFTAAACLRAKRLEEHAAQRM